MFPKNKRKQDKEILEYIKSLPCSACNKPGPSDAHHLKHRGSGGEDSISNCVPFCRTHHCEWHAIGPGRFLSKYPEVSRRIRNLGWTVLNNKLQHLGNS